MSALQELVLHYANVRQRLWARGIAEVADAPLRPAPKPKQIRELVLIETPHIGRPLAILLADIAKAHKLTVNDVRSHSRSQSIVRARHEFYYRAATETVNSYPAIGRFIGRDHTSIMSGIRTHCDRNGVVPYPRGLPERKAR